MAPRLVVRALLVLAALLAAVPAGLPVPLAVAALAVTFLFTPGLLLARFAFSHSTREISTAAALALSPFLTGASVAVLMVLGAPLPLVARGVALAVALLALVVPDPHRPADATPTPWVSWACAAAWTTLVAALLVGNRWLAPRSDGWYHAAATLQVLQRGVPPEDPYFAGVRMLYFWGIHAWAASWLALAPRLSVYTPFVAFNIAAAAAVVLAVAGFARRLGAGAAGVTFAVALATLGYSPFGWVIIIARAMVGRVHGLAEFQNIMGQGASPVIFAMARWQLHGSMAFFGDKYLVLTQFSMGLALLALTIVALLDLASSPGPRTALAFGLLAAAALFIHTVVGDCMVIAAGVVWLSLVPGALRGGPVERRALVALTLATALAVLAVSPYLLEITQGKRNQIHAGFSVQSLCSLVIGGMFVVTPGFTWLAMRARRSPDALRVLLIAGVLAVLAMTLLLFENNQVKFFNLLFLALSAPAALGWLAWMRVRSPLVRRLAVIVLVAGALPTAALSVWGFATERGQSVDGWHPPTAAMSQAMAWVREHTPADAAFCDIGGGRELGVMAGRSLVWGGWHDERNFGYDPDAILERRDLAGALCRGLEPGPRGAALLARFRREIVVMTRAAAPDSNSDHGAVAARPDRFEPLWRNAEVAFWRVRVP